MSEPQRKPFGKSGFIWKIFLTYFFRFLGEIGDVGIKIEGCPRLVHSDMAVESDPDQHDVKRFVGRYKLIDPLAFPRWVCGDPVKKFDFCFVDCQGMKKIAVHHIPAGALPTLINSDPFVQTNKRATVDIHASGFDIFYQAAKDLYGSISGCQTNNSIRFVSNILTDPVGGLPRKS